MNTARRRIASLAASLCAAVGVTVAASGPAGASHWVYIDALGDGGQNTAASDRNNDGWYDIAYTDTNYDGTWDLYQLDADYNGSYEWVWARGAFPQEFWLHDHNGDGYQEHVYFDLDGNGLLEIQKWDGDGDRVFEWTAVDYSGDGVADTWVSGTPSTPSTSTAARRANDTMVKQIVFLNQLRQCYQPGRC